MLAMLVDSEMLICDWVIFILDCQPCDLSLLSCASFSVLVSISYCLFLIIWLLVYSCTSCTSRYVDGLVMIPSIDPLLISFAIPGTTWMWVTLPMLFSCPGLVHVAPIITKCLVVHFFVCIVISDLDHWIWTET
jgi:hypothetical protein